MVEAYCDRFEREISVEGRRKSGPEGGSGATTLEGTENIRERRELGRIVGLGR